MAEIKGNNNVYIKGNNNQVIRFPKEENKEFSIPINGFFDSMIPIGRKLWSKGAKRFYQITIIPLALLLIVFIFLIFKIVADSKTGILSSNSIYLSLVIGITAMPFGALIKLSTSRTCQNKQCSQHFAYREHKPQKHIGQRRHRGVVYHHIKQFLKCEYCGHEIENEYVDEEDTRD